MKCSEVTLEKQGHLDILRYPTYTHIITYPKTAVAVDYMVKSDSSIFAIAGLDFSILKLVVVSTIIAYIGYVFSNDNIINTFW
jgi:hypothetical protein